MFHRKNSSKGKIIGLSLGENAIKSCVMRTDNIFLVCDFFSIEILVREITSK